jgi:hypothetical protein
LPFPIYQIATEQRIFVSTAKQADRQHHNGHKPKPVLDVSILS